MFYNYSPQNIDYDSYIAQIQAQANQQVQQMQALKAQSIANTQPLQQQPTQVQPQQSQQIIFASVKSESEAEKYLIEPGQTIIMVQDDSIIYKKSHDKGTWREPELRKYEYKENEPIFVMPDIETTTGIDDVKKDIAELKSMMEAFINGNDSKNIKSAVRSTTKTNASIKQSGRDSKENAEQG